MNVAEYAQYDGLGLAELVKKSEVTAKELGKCLLTAVEQVNPQINAVIETYGERVAAMSQDDKPKDGIFAGVPFLLKDLGIMEAGKKSESGSRLGKGWMAREDAWLTKRFKEAGLSLLGRTTTPEFGLSGSTESLLTGKTRNPWDLSKMAGGSSGGAAAAVSSGILPMAHASDGAGSIRIPASCCNLVGLKVSRGRVSRYPRADHAYEFSVDFIVSRSVRDTAAMLDAIGGPAPGDFAIITQPVRPYLQEFTRPQAPLRIAFTTERWGPVATDPEIVTLVERVAQQCEQMGHFVTIASPRYDYDEFLEAMLVVWAMGADAHIDGLAEEMGRKVNEETLEPVTLSFYQYAKTITTSDFVQAIDVLNKVNRQTGHFFEQHDLLLTPSLSLLPKDIGRYSQNTANMPFADFFRHCDESMAYFPLANKSGLPAISLPLGMSQSGLPMGVQFMAGFGDEATLIRIAKAFEEAMPWDERKPAVHVSHLSDNASK